MHSYQVKIIDESKTGIKLVTIIDKETEFQVSTPSISSDLPIASLLAFSGARYSRSASPIEDILTEIKNSGQDTDKKLANIFHSYGHASVADMANIMIYIENVPKSFDWQFFYETSLGGGQGRSSRYQNFSNLENSKYNFGNSFDSDHFDSDQIFELENEYNNLQNFSKHLHLKWMEKLRQPFIEFYKIDINNKKHLNTLNSRLLDASRYFLTNGGYFKTAFCWVTSAREWSRIIAKLKAHPDTNFQKLAKQIEFILSGELGIPKDKYLQEASQLIKYTSTDERTLNKLKQIKNIIYSQNINPIKQSTNAAIEVKLITNVSPSQKVLIQSILSLRPELDFESCLNFLNNNPNIQDQLAQIMFSDFDHHNQMSNLYKTGEYTFEISMSMIELADFNRHRAFGRFCPILENPDSISNLDFNDLTYPLYLDSKELNQFLSQYKSDLNEYLTKLQTFISKLGYDKQKNNIGLIHELLPLGLKLKYYLHCSIKELSYMTSLRVRPGGHINYRMASYYMLQLVKRSDPSLTSLNNHVTKPDISSSEEFLDRS